MFKHVNLIGALTSKPYSFKARTWELKSIQTIDLFESLCSNVQIDIRGSDIMRILPIANKLVNDCWISDKTRYAYDGLKKKRFVNPMIKEKNLFIEQSWTSIWYKLTNIFSNVKLQNYNNFIIKTGNFTDLEHIIYLKKLVKTINRYISIIINSDYLLSSDFQNNYLIDNNIFSIKTPKVFIFVGTNFKNDNPILNIKLNKLKEKKCILMLSISGNQNIKYHISNNISILNLILRGKHSSCTIIYNFIKKNLKNKKIKNLFKNSISIIFGAEYIRNKFIIDYNKLILLKNKINYLKFETNNLISYSGIININELGFYTNNILTNNFIKKNNIFYLLNCENCSNIKKNDFVIFQGHHNNDFYHKFNMILPVTNWLEKSSLYLNCLGILQKTEFCLITKEKKIQSDYFLNKNFFDLFNQFLLLRKKMPNRINEVAYNNIYRGTKKEIFHKFVYEKTKYNITKNVYENLNKFWPNALKFLNKNLNIDNLKLNTNKILLNKFNKNYMPLKLNIFDYYLITSVEKSSNTMIQCSKKLMKNNNFNKI